MSYRKARTKHDKIKLMTYVQYIRCIEHILEKEEQKKQNIHSVPRSKHTPSQL